MFDKIQIDIVSGFLGSGKTTFIKTLANNGVFEGEKIAILENEFGTIDFDGENLAQGGLIVESVNAGCICCSGANSFVGGIQTIVEKFAPHRILIEPSGVARLSDIKRLITMKPIAETCELGNVITIVDGKNYYARLKISKEFFEDQIKFSQIVFLSKAELLSSSQIIEIKKNIKAVNPTCIIVDEDWNQLDRNRYTALLDAHRALPLPSLPVWQQESESNSFECYSYTYPKQIARKTIDVFFEEVVKKNLGDIHRVKGEFADEDNQQYTIEYVPGELRIEPRTERRNDGGDSFRISIIGFFLDKELITKTFKI